MSKELMIERIEKAQKEIEAKRETVQQGKFRQDYHFMAETGWINTIRLVANGALCTGDMLSVKI